MNTTRNEPQPHPAAVAEAQWRKTSANLFKPDLLKSPDLMQYFENRLVTAFLDGWHARGRHMGLDI